MKSNMLERLALFVSRTDSGNNRIGFVVMSGQASAEEASQESRK